MRLCPVSQVPSSGGWRGQLSGVPGGLPGAAASPPSPQHCEASWRCHLAPALPPSPFWASACGGLADCCLGKILRPLSPAPPVGISLYVGPFCVSHLKVSFLWTGLADPGCADPMPGDHLMGWVEARHRPDPAMKACRGGASLPGASRAGVVTRVFLAG